MELDGNLIFKKCLIGTKLKINNKINHIHCEPEGDLGSKGCAAKTQLEEHGIPVNESPIPQIKEYIEGLEYHKIRKY